MLNPKLPKKIKQNNKNWLTLGVPYLSWNYFGTIMSYTTTSLHSSRPLLGEG